MSMFLIFVLSVLGLTLADGEVENKLISATPMCTEYADCLAKAQQKAQECHLLENNTETTNGKQGQCTEVKRVHHEIREIHDKIAGDIESCVRDNIDEAIGLNAKKFERCETILKKNAKRSIGEPQKRKAKKEKNSLKAAAKTCNKDARKMKSQCARLAKCCSVAKTCHKNEDKTKLEEMKKQLKEVTKECTNSRKKGKKGKKGEEKEREGKKGKGDNRRSIGKSLERAAKKKLETPIGGKKLLAQVEDLPHA